MNGVAPRVLAAAFLAVAATDVVIGVLYRVTWPYAIASVCVLISCGLLWQGVRDTEPPRDTSAPNSPAPDVRAEVRDDRPHEAGYRAR